MEAWIIERDADGYGDGGRTDADWPELRTTFASGCFVDVRTGRFRGSFPVGGNLDVLTGRL
eukprot:m.23017 g.23017  ORF g.23017 m.23017 type:complete len:61 (+) comp28432_c0_seq1:499-681(+)